MKLRLILALSLLLVVAPAVSMACYKPGAHRAAVEHEEETWHQRQAGPSVGTRYNVVSTKWTETATDGSGLQRGDSITLTWSVVPDGTQVMNPSGVYRDSKLREFLDDIYGDEDTWMDILEEVFDSWSEISGVTYVYEPYDDGANVESDQAGTYKGVLGVRGDVRLSGIWLDGNGDLLARNWYPKYGSDMIIDTGDDYYNNTNNNSRRLRNVMAHELGHGLGLLHVCPKNETKLMEPTATTAFDGPQYDDILGANRLFGDHVEANDTPGTATALGALASGEGAFYDKISIDSDSDADYFSFSVDGSSLFSVIAEPNGKGYKSGTQASSGACFSGSWFRSQAVQDLEVNILDSTGSTVVQAIDATSAGGTEKVTDYELPAGDYYVEVAAFTTDAAQLYDLTIFAGATNVFDHGRVDTDENTRTVSFSSMPDARVVMGPASREGNDPGEIRLGNVGDSSFQHVFQEWDYLDGGHNKEKASWLALPDGASSLGSLDAEAGAVSVKHAWKTVSFERTFSSIPVVIPTVTTKNGWAAVVTRLRNVSTTGFQIRLQEEEAADDIHHFETVHWVAIEPGATGANGHKIEVGHTGDVVTESNVFIWVPSNMSDSPKFLAAAQTYGGPDPASLRFSKANMGILGEAIAVHMDEEQSQDNETDHSAENVGYIFID